MHVGTTWRCAQSSQHPQAAPGNDDVQGSPVAAGLLGDLRQRPLRHVQVREVAAAPALVRLGVARIVARAPAQKSIRRHAPPTLCPKHHAGCDDLRHKEKQHGGVRAGVVSASSRVRDLDLHGAGVAAEARALVRLAGAVLDVGVAAGDLQALPAQRWERCVERLAERA